LFAPRRTKLESYVNSNKMSENLYFESINLLANDFNDKKMTAGEARTSKPTEAVVSTVKNNFYVRLL
ncbi:hypothetical protein P5673_033311, partial [Acropora cervicornis]